MTGSLFIDNAATGGGSKVAWSELTAGRSLPAGVHFVQLVPPPAGEATVRVAVVN